MPDAVERRQPDARLGLHASRASGATCGRTDGSIAPTARCCTTGAWQGHGIAWRSGWEVEAEIAAGLLVRVLDDFAAPPNGIYAVFPQRKHLPLRVRLWIDFLKHSYGDTAYWKS